MAWNLSGELVETCSCNMLCPCWYGVKELMIMDRVWCASPWLLRIQSGASDGVEIPAVDAVLAGFWPGPTLLDGGGIARLYFDDSVSDGTRVALEFILQGQRGGPPAIIGGLISTWLPTSTTNISVSVQGGNVTADIGNVGHIESRRLVNDLGDTMKMSDTGFTVGLQFREATAELAPSNGTSWRDPELAEPFDCLSGAVGQFDWSD